MAGSEAVVWVQLSMRIPKALQRELKLHCVTAETPVMDFVVKAIEEKLASSASTPAKRRRTKA
jgi:hypothetical protein